MEMQPHWKSVNGFVSAAREGPPPSNSLPFVMICFDIAQQTTEILVASICCFRAQSYLYVKTKNGNLWCVA